MALDFPTPCSFYSILMDYTLLNIMHSEAQLKKVMLIMTWDFLNPQTQKTEFKGYLNRERHLF